MLIHGRGADEHDLFPLADALDPERRLVAVLPRGPLRLPPGGAHWYVVYEVGRPDPAHVPADLRRPRRVARRDRGRARGARPTGW